MRAEGASRNEGGGPRGRRDQSRLQSTPAIQHPHCSSSPPHGAGTSSFPTVMKQATRPKRPATVDLRQYHACSEAVLERSGPVGPGSHPGPRALRSRGRSTPPVPMTRKELASFAGAPGAGSLRPAPASARTDQRVPQPSRSVPPGGDNYVTPWTWEHTPDFTVKHLGNPAGLRQSDTGAFQGARPGRRRTAVPGRSDEMRGGPGPSSHPGVAAAHRACERAAGLPPRGGVVTARRARVGSP
ncbi:hypothetical protein SAMN05216246_106113 [Actinomyces denticolens]|uniref:Uncharacterized protein n=1 Tax=Actinomyces denticolens TaxID=52767 RepID=A0ABY1IAL2_9ACTO|nr:hypothetical protein SAMN05216246_106113 [Actinomyces denticolens]